MIVQSTTYIYRVIWEPSVSKEFMTLHEPGMVMINTQWGASYVHALDYAPYQLVDTV